MRYQMKLLIRRMMTWVSKNGKKEVEDKGTCTDDANVPDNLTYA